MKIVINVGYDENKANSASLSFQNQDDSSPTDSKKILLENIAGYEPGKFYLRELPCILASLNQYDLDKVDMIIVDGFVWLNSEKKPGLGAYLFEKLEKKIRSLVQRKESFMGRISL